MSLVIGDPAPDFSLPHRPGHPPVSLSALRGRKVVLLFVPLAFSTVCTRELCAVRDDFDAYRDLDAEVLGISVDSPFALQAWAELQGIAFPLLSDFNRTTSRAYGALYDDYFGLQGVSKRAAFVVDREGRVAFAEVLEDSGNLPDLAAIRSILAQLP
ncbi:MAG TPA: redoxin domain-containing protein [Thermoanaerobaculia bacterium]|nr:redoxin domain-containing protein [Thermoanaerobaculia bacterium]